MTAAEITVDTATLAERLASFAARTYADGPPADVVTSVRHRVLDVLGLCVAAQGLPTSQAIVAHVAEQGGRQQASAVGLAEPVPAASAAFVNGVLAHSLDYDDTHLPSVLHPSACVIPAALAAAEAAGATGRDTVAAIAVGLEIAVRLGMAGYDRDLGNSVYFEHGQHATSICGAMGAAAAAALLSGLGESGVLHALGVTASFASGVIEANRTGGTVKRLHCGWAAQSAVTAAGLVRRGFTGPPTVLEGRFGFFQAFLRDQTDLDQVVGGLGADWSVPGIFFKPYPANHFTHTAIDAGTQLRAEGVPVDDLTEIQLRVPTAVIRTIGQPIETKRAPETGYQAQFSGPYAVVTGLLGGSGLGAGLADFTDALAADPRRRALMAKVSVVGDARCDAIFPNQFPAIVTVRTADGREWTAEVLANRGGPQRPLSEAELAAKFTDNVARRLAPATAATVRELALTLDSVADLGALLHPLTRLESPGDDHD
ncbi:MmgE/PrpD family protein [Actinophytocola algeriensis]|uniref:2-methylcitrate dehydratase PrpD n=1 Tax=Actinophytocola algeriensis TaxID=1768010 RepID=A0A7W7Q1I6_9PSEU|nr:MmgE/PrpD family protein [Actinophytocola algeriensis]MBB4905256.1 2-methylcitrate dehydratase PrpD [Actinophytocola algeriensis]MBE1473059.1 2-methylcitrate dehydratase PrpD [Actinophytocola algeriensis]